MIISIATDGVEGIFLNTRSAVAYDYIKFMKAFIETLEEAKGDLEKQANDNGKTILHDMVDTFGAKNLDQ